jgi:hypothetical protein
MGYGEEAHASRCFVTAAAGGQIDANWRTAAHAEDLAGLPADLAAQDVEREELLLFRDQKVSIYLTPFDQYEPRAQIALVGLTPGRSQMHLAVTTAAAALRHGASIDEAVTRAKDVAGFAGPLRRNLVTMLDGIGMQNALGLPTCEALFADRTDLVTKTSAICHAVFYPDGRNYSGASPSIERHPVLRAFAQQVLAANLAMVPDALIIPLGDAAKQAVALAGIDPHRVLFDFPHPSGGNGHRAARYLQHRESLTAAVTDWASAS